ncbi:MAG TPA: 4Fe-4S dicluster domain-containing protein [Prolixibacteraceae bacterium]
MEVKYISEGGIEQWFKIIVDSGKRVYAPVNARGQVDFKLVKNLGEVASEYIQTTQSVKASVYQKAEVLFSYEKVNGKVELKDFDPESVPETVLWKVHPCDAAGFKPLSAIFNWDTPDKMHNAHLVKTTIVSFSCPASDESCFCSSVNGSPGNTAGSDIQLTMLPDGGAIVEIFTIKGEALIALMPSVFEADKGEDKQKYLAVLPAKFNLEEVNAKLNKAFDSTVWKEQSERCIGCGACAFVCPTCACFDIQEDAHGSKGRRIRCWDACGFGLFTLHTSGHNPREHQSQRWRQRILHKFSYMPERLSVVGCTGCGRCSRACPVDMNILEHITSIAAQ